MHKLKKALLICISTIAITVIVIILFISPITKYLIEKYDEKFTGRQITLDWAYVNPFTGYIHLNNLKINELKSDSVFFSAKGVSANFAMLKLFSKTYEISNITLDQPRGIIIIDNKNLNFNDLIERFSPKKGADTSKAPFHFNILDIKINNGTFYYHAPRIPINYSIKNVNIESTGKWWNADTMTMRFSFLSGTGSGDMKGDFTINFKTNAYSLAVVARKYSMDILDQYLNDLTNYGSFSANLDADIKSKGNFNDEENITASGLVAINDFHFGKNPKDDYASFKKLTLSIDELSPKNHKYLFDSVSLNLPYFKYELYDHLDNLQTMFGKNGSNVTSVTADPTKFNLIIEIGRYVQVLSKNFFQSNYKVNRLAIYNGDLKFNDYSQSEKFTVDLNPLNITADSIDKNHQWVNVFLKSGIRPYGNAAVALRISPKESADFDIQYHFQKLPVSAFNPYIISYTSFPLDRGTIGLNGAWHVRNGIIQSNNHLLIIDPRVASRLRNKDTKWIPMPLIMAFIRNYGNIIDYEIPISGDLKKPKFHWHDVIFDLLGNMFVKPITTPYIIDVRTTETEIEKSLTLKWQMRNGSLRHHQERFIKKMASFLAENPEAFITIYPQHYTLKEKEYILFFEAKKKYFLLINAKNKQSFSKADSETVIKMSVKDSFFVHYLNRQIKDPMVFTIQEKCSRFVDSAIVNIKFNQLNIERANTFISCFKEMKVDKQIKTAAGQSIIPYNGFSFYKIEYKNKFPEDLLKAYRKMNELNDEVPRKEFEKERKKNKNTL